MTVYNMVRLASDLGFSDEKLYITRERGEQAYPLLATMLRVIPEGNPLVLVFPSGQLIDGSFADESIIRLGEQIVRDEFGERCILLQGLSTDSVVNIEAMVSYGPAKLAFLMVEPTGAWRCIGQIEPSLAETLELVAARESLTAPELAKLTGLAINSASNRLKRLYDQKLVRRQHDISEKGLQYIYRFWTWTDHLDGVEDKET